MPIDKIKNVAFPQGWKLEVYLEEQRRQFEQRLQGVPAQESRETKAGKAVRHVLATPGKRFRPLLVMATADIFERGGDPAISRCAVAIECIHQASLILDDLPCMDDAQMRRGVPTLHREFGEADAILAAMALISEAHHQINLDSLLKRSELRRLRQLHEILSRAYSLDGLTGGQSDDLQNRTDLDLASLEFVHAKKTGTLFCAAVELACVCCNARRGETAQLIAFARNLGLAFQIKDDLLDLKGPEITGKDYGQDHKKTTFVSLIGEKKCQELHAELMANALEQIRSFAESARHLRELTHAIWHRDQ